MPEARCDKQAVGAYATPDSNDVYYHATIDATMAQVFLNRYGENGYAIIDGGANMSMASLG